MTPTSHRRWPSNPALTILPFLVLLAVAPGCKAAKSIESLWPTVETERTVPKPPTPPRWPLTGLDAPSDEAALVRPVSVKIENAAAARPQSGLDQADVVYETVTEAGITRFNAVFQSKSPKVVGPVRSARASDLHIVPQYKALFAHCGGESNLQKALKAAKFHDMDQFFWPDPYYRSREKPAPHNLFLRLGDLRQEAVSKRGFEPTAAVRPFLFDRSSKETTPQITSVSVPFADDNRVSWAYNSATGLYARSINGKVHKDKLSGKQYTARNVVVMWARVQDRAHTDVNGVASVEITLLGQGRASVFRNGQRYTGTWEAVDNAPPVFKAEDGSRIKLSPGNTWFQVIANEQDIVVG